MGKRAKKKVQSAPAKLVAGSRIASSPPPSSTSSPLENGRLGEKANALVEAACSHGANIDKLRTQLAKSTAIHCLECFKLRSGPASIKDRRVKGKPLKKKVHSQSAVSPWPEEKVSNHKLWICLSCGHSGCGVGNSSSPGTNSNEKVVAKQGTVGRGHAWQHWLQLKHPMVMQYGDGFVCWCFQCESAYEHNPTELETVESSEMVTSESLEVEIQKSREGEVDFSAPPSRAELLQQCAKLVQKKLMEQVADVKRPSVADSTDQDDGKQKIVAGPENTALEEGETGKPKRIIKGLLNLGNTCFFNSVMQNLLGVEVLRDHFLAESTNYEGPLTTSLRKFFQEITVQPPGETLGVNNLEGGLKRGVKARGGWSGLDGVHNPKCLFGAICAKVPRFKGYQQQDSHELLKCLLDGLHTEEETARKLFTTPSSEADDRNNGIVANGDERELSSVSAVQESGTDGSEKKKQAPAETFIERVFGGQLSSTVSCCECGHSSVVYEPFLDLSLSIPVKKTSPRPTPLQRVSEQGTTRVLSNVPKNQGTQSFRSKSSQPLVKTSDRNDLDDDVLNSGQIAGLGTPILLLPPPPKKNSSVDNLTLSTVSDDTSWLEFLDEPEDLGSQVTYGCAPNPEGYMLGCEENGAYIKQASIAVTDIASLHALSAHRFEEVVDESEMDGGVVTTVSSADHSVDIPPCEKLLLLDAPRQSWDEAHILSNWFDSDRSNFASTDGPEEDGYVQIRGGSESQVLLLTQGSGSDFLYPEPVGENSSNPGMSAEQSGNCGDDSTLHSENLVDSGGTVLPLDSTQGDYDGVASLFEEEESADYAPPYGPFPLNHDATGYEGSSGFEEVGLDDVLDLGKISCEGRDDWLVCTSDRQDDDSEDVTMSLEGCLQIFTRPEILSGENAWGCENCTNKYHEKLAAGLAKSSVTLPQKDSGKRVTKKGRLENGIRDVSDLDKLGGQEPLSSSTPKGDVGTEQEALAVNKDIGEDHASNSGISPHKETKCSGTGTGVLAVKVYPLEDVEANEPSTSMPTTSMPPISSGNGSGVLDPGVDAQALEAVEDAGLEETGQVESQFGSSDTRQESENVLSVLSKSDQGELLDAPSFSLSNGSIMTIDKGRDVSGSQNSNRGHIVEGDGFQVERSEAGAGEAGKTTSLPGSGRTVKLTKSRSKKVVAEPRKVVKQEATKRYLISKAPPVLVVQLKRFARDIRGRLSKLYGPVAFQEWLDLHPYVDHRHVISQNCRYRLTGTVEHTGTLKGGHYVAYVRGPSAPATAGLKHDAKGNPSRESTWYHISDSYVRQTSLDAVLKSEAYLLFYERC